MSFNHYYQSELSALCQLSERRSERSPVLMGSVSRLSINVTTHIIFCAELAITNGVNLSLYKNSHGNFALRDITAGRAAQTALIVFIITNLLPLCTAHIYLKTYIALITPASIAMLLPDPPLRALFYATLTAGLSTTALLVLAVKGCSLQKRSSRTSENPMPNRLRYKIILIMATIFLLTPLATWLYVKLSLSRSTEPHATTWSPSRACYINAYIPNFSSLGIPGKLIKLFSSDAFFRVYHQDGRLLKSSEWLLWQREFADSESEKWINTHAIYPTNDGYAGWSLRECDQPTPSIN